MADGTTIHDRVQIIKNESTVETGGGPDYSVPKHGPTHNETGSDPIPGKLQDPQNAGWLDEIPVEMDGILDGEVPTYDATEGKFKPGSGSGGAGPYAYLDLTPQDPAPAYAEGRFFYDDETKTISIFNDQSGVQLNVGRELWVRAFNDTGVAIPNGTVVVCEGADGDVHPKIRPVAADEVGVLTVLGVATQDIPDQSHGEVTRFGVVNDVDTSGFALGDVLYLDTVAGQWTNTRPDFPAKPILVGRVLKVGASDGVVIVVITIDPYDFEFDGCVVQRQDTFVVEDTGTTETIWL